MAKKYLLYIHDSRFENEEKKSELVNRLLSNHYKAPEAVSGLERAIIYESAKKRERIKKEDALLSDKSIIEAIPKLVEKPCKHGYPPKYCKFAKGGKPCGKA